MSYLKHGSYCTGLWAWLLRKVYGYDGCYFCYRERHFK
jgi:hypothetical protein